MRDLFLCVVLLVAAVTSQDSGSGRFTAGQAGGDREERHPLADENGLIPEVFRRVVPADVLRDHQGLCFASTNCKLYRPETAWNLAPFCGQSICDNKLQPGELLEVIQDCGPKPVSTNGCTLEREERNATEHPWPNCCPVYKCPPGVKVDYGLDLPPQPPVAGGRPNRPSSGRRPTTRQ